MIEPITATCRPARTSASPRRRRNAVTEKRSRASNSSSAAAVKIAMLAAYCGVLPPWKIRSSSTPKGTTKNSEVISSARPVGRSLAARGRRS